jgi:hypothetical protein
MMQNTTSPASALAAVEATANATTARTATSPFWVATGCQPRARAATAARAEQAAWTSPWELPNAAEAGWENLPLRQDAARASERAAQASLLRCIFGNPFRPVSINPAWQTPTVRSLAQAAYDNRILPAGTLSPVGIDRRATSHMSAWTAQVVENGLVRTTGLFQRVGQDRQANAVHLALGHDPLLVGSPRQRDSLGR